MAPRFAVRPRTLVIAMAAVVLVAAGVGWYLALGQTPPGRVELRDFSEDETATVGIAGSFPGEGGTALSNPLGVAWDGDTLYVAESDAGRISLFDERGGSLGSIAVSPADDQGAFYPSSLALADDDRLAIVDNAASRVVVVPTEPAEAAEVLLVLGGTKAPGQPTAVSYADGEYFVFDAAASAVLVYGTEGEYLRTLGDGLQPKVSFASAMCILDGRLYLADTNAGRVIALDADTGEQTLVFADRYTLPRAVVPLEGDTLAVVDTFDQAVYITSSDGERRDVIDAESVPDGVLSSPRGAAWVSSSQRLYVTDAVSGIVAVYNVRLEQ